MKTEESFGFVVVLRGSPDRFLLVRQFLNWSFPKGHGEVGETPLDTARRELFEECGVTDVEVLPDKTFTEEYDFERDGEQRHKRNTFFLAMAKDDVVRPLPGEILECRFASYEEAMELFEFENAKRILHEAREALRAV